MVYAQQRRFYKFFTGRGVLFICAAAAVLIAFGQFIGLQNLFVIMDGDDLLLYRSFDSDVNEALRLAGVTVNGGDTYISSTLNNNSKGNIAEVLVSRTAYVTVAADGRTHRVRADGSVSEMLGRAGITLRPRDEVSPALSMPTSDGMEITVVRREFVSETVTEPIPFDTERIATKNLTAGNERVTQTGVPGEREFVYQMEYRDGEEFSREMIRETVTLQPRTEIIEYGTGGTVLIDGVYRRYTRVIDCIATAYTTEGRTQKKNAGGKIARRGTIAVDPRVIKLGTTVFVQAPTGTWIYGVAVAEDTGGVIKGNKIDLYFDTVAECYAFGRRAATVYILE